MIIQHIFKSFFLIAFVATLASCTTQKLATQNADDVYFKDVEAVPVTYTAKTEKAYQDDYYNDRNGYDRNDDYYYDGYQNNSRFDIDTWRNGYSWRDYYYMNRFNYDPFFYGPSSYLGFNNFYGSGWGFSLGYNSPFYSYNMPFYDTSYWNYYGSFYGNSPYWGIYSYYNPGYYGNYYGGYYGGYYGNPYYGGYYGTARTSRPRLRDSYDNNRGGGGTSRMPIPDSRATRPTSNDINRPRAESVDRNGNYNPYGRPTRPTGSSTSPSTDRRTQGQPASQPTSRPTRPTNDRGSSGTREPASQPVSRPTRSETPSYTPSRSTESSGSSSSGSSRSGGSSSGGSSSGRPTR